MNQKVSLQCEQILFSLIDVKQIKSETNFVNNF